MWSAEDIAKLDERIRETKRLLETMQKQRSNMMRDRMQFKNSFIATVNADKRNSTMNDCCKNEENHSQSEKFKDVITVQEGFYYTVYITYCKCCGTIIENKTWIE